MDKRIPWTWRGDRRRDGRAPDAAKAAEEVRDGRRSGGGEGSERCRLDAQVPEAPASVGEEHVPAIPPGRRGPRELRPEHDGR